jgi:hypothetical protein
VRLEEEPVTAPTPTDATTESPPPSPRRRRRRWVGVAALVAIVLLAVVLLWFQPQVLLYDTVVEDDFPTAAPRTEPADADQPVVVPAPDPAASDGEGAAPEEAVTPPEEPPVVEEPVALVTGSFDSRNRYTVTGTATVYELPDATRILRLEGFESTNGPDLLVYLTVGDSSEPSDAALAADHVDLGVLRGNVGDQNYDLPSDVDLAHFDTVVIWCRRFGTAFGAADLR